MNYRVTVPTLMTSGAAGFPLGIPSQRRLMSYRLTRLPTPMTTGAAEFPLGVPSQKRLMNYRMTAPTPMTSGAAGLLLGVQSQMHLMSYRVTFFQLWMTSEAAEHPLNHFSSPFPAIRSFNSSHSFYYPNCA